jgi:hypothetical protein
MMGFARWIESLVVGETAIGLCVIAVAFVGALMLSGRMPLREGMRVAMGCFVLLGAPTIAAGFVGGSKEVLEGSAPLQVLPPNEDPRPEPPPAHNDPYAGASFGSN